MSYSTISLVVTDSIATVSFARPQARNAFNGLQRRELQNAVAAVAEDPCARVLVLTGSGDSFSAGQDPAERIAPAGAAAWMEEWGATYAAILAVEIPVIAAINGHAAGAGLQIAMLADIRIAADDSTLSFVEIEHGLPVITGSALMLPLASMSMIQDMALTARVLNGRDALMAGIVSRSVPRDAFPAAVDVLARQLSAIPSAAVRLNKLWWRKLRGTLLEDALAEGRRAHTEAHSAREI